MNDDYELEEDKYPAVPPEDYKGTIADWITALYERSLIPDNEDIDWYGDVLIDGKTYMEILKECEGENE